MPDRAAVRRSYAARPAGVIRPSAISSGTRLRLTALHVLVALRGVKRIMYASPPNDLRMPSIHPYDSASSTDCGHVRLGFPVCTLWKPTQSSGALSWFFASQRPNSFGEEKKTGSGKALLDLDLPEVRSVGVARREVDDAGAEAGDGGVRGEHDTVDELA